MRPRASKTRSRFLSGVLLAAVFFVGVSSLSAQQQMSSMPLGSVVKGFVMPQRNAAGDLVANITGAQANVVSLNRTQITGLKVEMYEDGKVSTTITAPACDYWTLEKRISGHDGVLVEKADVRITAAAIDWDFKTQTAVLHRNVRVVLPQFTVGAPTAKPAPAPAAPAPAEPLPAS
jgi:hypothetical protein